ncbi:tRNA lysidine(34) synthetase [Caviibacter abscessus]|uniref:tRNA lysidine(34) synthetase n=1 Tax=Caviibacter abscessus TaxID=1766719 RepID=UPI0008301CA3|nr:ATP-binding protein [Caviibacter abscessus]
MEFLKQVEESLVTTYRKKIYTPFLKTVHEFNLVENNDKIAIAISGGKDSLLLAKLFQELKKDKSKNFEFKAISLNPGFTEENLEQFKKNLEMLNIDCEIINTDIFDVAYKLSPESPCFLCAKMRRGVLYRELEKLGYTKIALGHHFDDVIETTLINMFYGASIKTMLPKVDSESGNLQVIRPLVYVEEKDIIRYTVNNGINAMTCGCKVAQGTLVSKRKEIKELLKTLEEKNPGIKKRIFNSMRNINLNYVFDYIPKK